MATARVRTAARQPSLPRWCPLSRIPNCVVPKAKRGYLSPHRGSAGEERAVDLIRPKMASLIMGALPFPRCSSTSPQLQTLPYTATVEVCRFTYFSWLPG